MISLLWGRWCDSGPWLLEVLESAEGEARGLGQSLVRPEHIAAALAGSVVAKGLLDELGVGPRRWRDRIVNTLLVQRPALSEPAWKERLTDEDRRGLTALFWSNVRPYGSFELDMDRHLDLDLAATA